MMKKGFTLIELLTAVAIFAVVMTISLGSILGIFDANRKTRSLKALTSNLNLAIESMSKEMRFGTVYHCGPGAFVPQSCPGGSSIMIFKASDGNFITYRLNNAKIEKAVAGGDIIELTAPEVVIDDLTFYVLGAEAGDTLQPKVLMRVKAHAGTGRSRSDLTLQTLVSQRLPDS